MSSFIYEEIAASGGPPREFAVGYGLSLKSDLSPRFDALPTPQIIKVARVVNPTNSTASD